MASSQFGEITDMSMKLCQLTGSVKKQTKKLNKVKRIFFLSLEGKAKRVKLKYWCEEKTMEQKKTKQNKKNTKITIVFNLGLQTVQK